MSERDKRAEGYNLKEDSGVLRDPSSITSLRVPVLKPMELMVEASPRRIFANAHTYHINSISVNSDQVSPRLGGESPPQTRVFFKHNCNVNIVQTG